jgi:2-polyprenyl-6-methoxyphenol hydroxylase-like FAD-dependent oxidoreductase
LGRIIVLGGGVIGLSTAMMLERDGHAVTVLERDPDPVPASPDGAWAAWQRRGVGQFRQPHYVHPAGRLILEAHLPEVKAALLEAGGDTFDMMSLLPPSIEDRAPRPGDERFVSLSTRRPVLEYAVARVAERRVEVRRGVTMAGLVTGASTATGVPHVTAVRTAEGETIHADLVIDATGRRSALPDWLASLGGRQPLEEAEDSGFIYYSRFFRSQTGRPPQFRAGLLTHFDSFSILALPGDANTWSVTVYIAAGDSALKRLHDLRAWTALVAACPLHAHLLEGEPITDIEALGGVLDRYRRLTIDGAPVVTGLVAVGDAWACTNPSLGRGVAMGLMHAAGTRDVIRERLGDPLALARAHDEMTETRLTPWYRNTIDLDRARVAAIRAAIEGRPIPPPTDPAGRVRAALMVAIRHDADLFRAFTEMNALLTLPREVMTRPGIVDAILDVASRHAAVPPPGPSRAETLRLLA